MDEYAAVVRKFYEVYRPIGRRYNLRVHSRFSMKNLASYAMSAGGTTETQGTRICGGRSAENTS